MRWNKITSGETTLYWECNFVNVPFVVRVVPNDAGVKAHLYFNLQALTSKTYPSIDVAQAEVHLFILEHLADYSAKVHRECLQAKVMTWRKLKEQLDQIPEDQLDERINHLDTDGYWIGEPRIELAEQDQYMDKADCTDVTNNITRLDDHEIVVEKGKYFLSTCEI